MSKSTKRLIIRLTIVSAVIALGVFALLSARNLQPVDPDAPPSGPSTSAGEAVDATVVEGDQQPTATTTARAADMHPAEPSPDPYGLAQLTARRSSAGGSFVPTLPPEPDPEPAETPVVRANADSGPSPAEPGVFEPSAAPAPQSAPATLATPVNPFDAMAGQGRNFEPLPPLRPTQSTAEDRAPVQLAQYTSPAAEPAADDSGAGYYGSATAAPSSAGEFAAPPIRVSDSSDTAATLSPPTANTATATGSPAASEAQPPPARFMPPAAATPRLTAGSADSSPSVPLGSGVSPAFSPAADLATSGQPSGLATPGPKELEGPRTPSLVVEKRAPPEVQVDKPAIFHIRVENVGSVEAENVVVHDFIPHGTRFVEATPSPTRQPDGTLLWRLGTIKPGDDVVIAMQLVPQQEGEIGSVATVSFQTQASVRTVCTRPVLVVKHTGPPKVLIGQSVTFDIEVSNTGTGVATGVTLEEDLPEQLAHSAGKQLEYEIGVLRPGESRKLQLTLQAVHPGATENVLIARGDGNLMAEDRQPIEVLAPQLQVGFQGPARRYLERQATYQVVVANPGTAPATNVQLVAHLPKGMQFISANNQGQYDPQQHAVYWSLAELPAGETGAAELILLPVEIGQQKLRVEGTADLNLATAAEHEVLVDGLAAVFFTVVDTADPIEVGSDTVYQIQLVNQGSKTATGVRVTAMLPAGLRPVGGDGPTAFRIDGQTIVFEPLARLAPKGEAIYKIQARGVQQGDHRITVQVASDEVRTPVSKEESTRVYADR